MTSTVRHLIPLGEWQPDGSRGSVIVVVNGRPVRWYPADGGPVVSL